MSGSGPWTAKIAVEPLYAGNTRIAYCLKVGIDTFFRNITSDEMEPGLRIEDLWRLPEIGFILCGERCLEKVPVGNDVYRLCGSDQAIKHQCHDKRGIEKVPKHKLLLYE